MIDVAEVIFVLLVLLIGLAWAGRKYGNIKNGFVAAVAIIVSAAVPTLWVFYVTQKADSITRAASIVVTPFLFILMLIPAGVGYALARPKEPK